MSTAATDLDQAKKEALSKDDFESLVNLAKKQFKK